MTFANKKKSLSQEKADNWDLFERVYCVVGPRLNHLQRLQGSSKWFLIPYIKIILSIYKNHFELHWSYYFYLQLVWYVSILYVRALLMKKICRLRCWKRVHRENINPSIFNTIRWLTRLLGQSIWCYKFFFPINLEKWK